MKNLELNEISNITYLSRPTEKLDMSMTSPATMFFTDFDQTEPLIVDASTSADLARLLMLKAHAKLNLVVDSDDKVLGVVSLEEVSDQSITAKLSKNIKRDTITVADLMVPKSNIQGLDYTQVEHADIETVIEHLKTNGQQYCLVVDKGSNKIRGVFSANDISRQLGVDIDVQDQSSFYKVFSH